MSPSTKRVLVVQHAEPENLGRIAEAVTGEHLEYACIRPDLGQPIPSNLNGYGGLILMGGPQSVYQEDQFPYLRAEKALTAHAITSDRPVLGICLGSQILAEVLGSRVQPGRAFELGWKKVTLSPRVADDPVLGRTSDVLMPLHWHGDVYDLPPGSEPVGSSELTPVQGFAFRKRFYGILFHLETTLNQLVAMVKAFPEDVSRAGLTAEALLVEAPARLAALREPGLEVFRRWASLISVQ